MAEQLGASVRWLTRSGGSLAATLALSIFSLACSESASPTSLRESPARARAAEAPSGQLVVIPGQYIVTFADSVDDVPGLAKKIANQYGSSPMFTYTSAIKGFAAKLPDQAIQGLQHNPQIESVEQDQRVAVSDVQLNPQSWGLDRIDQQSAILDYQYAYANTGAGVNVYIIDSGIRTTHTDFGGRAVEAFTAISDGYGAQDCIGHGTHVAGTVGSKTYGVAKGVQLYSVRVLGCDGSGTTSGVISGVDWVTSHRQLPAVANMSLGGSSSATLAQAVQNSINSGVVYVVAAGNSSVDACTITPANVGAAITVGASNQYNMAETYSDYGSCVDLYAPGRAIISTWFSSDTSVASMSGTSMASPHVAGAAALVLAANPTATPAVVASTIVANATPNSLSSVNPGTANLLLYTGFVGAASSIIVSAPPPPAPSPSTDQPPTASFTYSCPKGRCSFDASSSSDDIGIAAYAWDFGDGSTTSAAASQKTISHSYTKVGTYTVKLTVTDSSGHTTATTQSISIKHV